MRDDAPRTFSLSEAADAERWIRATFASWFAALTAAQRGAVEEYKGEGYRDVNARLRGEDASILDEELVLDLDRALAVFRLSEPVVVWQGHTSARRISLRDRSSSSCCCRAEPRCASSTLTCRLMTSMMYLRSISRWTHEPDDTADGPR